MMRMKRELITVAEVIVILEPVGADEHAPDDTDNPKKDENADEVVKVDGIHDGVL